MAWFTRAINVFRPNTLSRDIQREMAFHVAERRDDLIESGMTENEAAREARRRFGHQAAHHETTRDANMLVWLESSMNDLRQAARVLRKSPAFTFVAVLSLALGIGANTAIFSLINAVMLKSLPVSNAQELVTLSLKNFGSEWSNPIWEHLRDQQNVLAGVAAFSDTRFNLANGGEVRRTNGSWVSGNYFNTLGVNPAAGRLLTASDDTPGCEATAVLSYGFWQSEFGGKSSIIGSSISLRDHPFTIIGITPPEFFGAEVGQKIQIYTPLCAMVIGGQHDMLNEKHAWFLSVIGRLKPEQTVARAEHEMFQLTLPVLSNALPDEQVAAVQKDPSAYGFMVNPGVGELSSVRSQYSTALYALMAVVGVVLCIGCANVANLLLARSASREREIAVRFALGASRTRVIRQLLTETMLLAAFGALVGVLFARWSTGLLVGLLGSGRNPVNLDVPIDARVLTFTIVVAFVTALLFGLAPAWRSTRSNPQEAMRANSRAIASGHSGISLAKMLVAGQVALSLVLVVGAGLLLGTFRTLATINLGFKSENVLLVQAGFRTDAAADSSHTTQLQLLEQLRRWPGVISASASSGTPVSGNAWNTLIDVDGYTPANPRDAMLYLTQVTGDYFATLQSPLLLGRTFDSRDTRRSPLVAVISQTAAQKYFAGVNPIGQHFYLGRRTERAPEYEVVGVVADSKYASIKEKPRALAFLSISQVGELEGDWNFEVRATGSTRTLTAAVTAIAKQMDPRITLEFRRLDDQVGASITRERLLATLSVFFGSLALLLAMIGLYGTMSYSVQRRRNEIGVRLALGAAWTAVFRLVLGEVTLVLLAGLAVGTIVAISTSRFVATFLFGVKPNDVATIAWSIAALSAVALVAGALPAWRAARLDPMTALRED